MAFIGTALQELVKIRKRIRKRLVVYDAQLQEKTLRKLLTRAKGTQFGLAYDFKSILRKENIRKAFQKNVPIYDYNKLYEAWWHRTLQGVPDVTWPGKIKYYALTSGTSESASKRVPVSKRMIQSIRKASIRQMLSIPDFKVPPEFYEKGVLMIGGSTQLKKIPHAYEGDLSGILQSTIPRWFERFYKPGKEIAELKDWDLKLDEIARQANKWDIGIICGIPAWIQLLFDKILKIHKVKNIHEIWPNFRIYVHGGVSFTPYKDSFKKYLGDEIFYLDTYLASEGFLALQSADNHYGMQLILDNWVYFEFIPFNEKNFSSEGNLKENPEVLLIDEIKEGEEYALLISTCAGSWRYLIGDVIKFTSLANFEIQITGRTKHFLSLCGEHLSVDNMNMAIRKLTDEIKVNINEFTVTGITEGGEFGHHWYLGVDREVNNEVIKTRLDELLCELNDDYCTERKHALKKLTITTLPTEKFYAFLKHIGKLGGQNKFPRVIKNGMLDQWREFIKE